MSDSTAKRRAPGRRLHIERRLKAMALEKAELETELAAMDETDGERFPIDPMPTEEDRDSSRWP